MRTLRQFLIILLFSLAGEALHALLPLPVPASIYGIVLLLACLMTGIVRADAIREVSSFLIEIMPVMFIPAAVGLMESFGLLLPSLGAYIAIMVVSTFVVMAVAGRVTQAVIRRQAAKEEHPDA
ncbi:MAG: CidA/LrgA family protein [Candidatus Ventricola sp.]